MWGLFLMFLELTSMTTKFQKYPPFALIITHMLPLRLMLPLSPCFWSSFPDFSPPLASMEKGNSNWWSIFLCLLAIWISPLSSSRDYFPLELLVNAIHWRILKVFMSIIPLISSLFPKRMHSRDWLWHKWQYPSTSSLENFSLGHECLTNST